MADVLHFDPETALDDMLKVFWQQGFKATTTRELAESAGLSEGSLFNTFGSKRDLYTTCLQRYTESAHKLRSLLEKEDFVLEGIRDYWMFICKYAANPNSKGCMITNASIEHANDEDFIAQIKKLHQKSERTLKKALDRAVANGELSDHIDTTAIAQFLFHSTQGIRVMGRLSPSKEKMNNIADVTLSVLDQYRI